MTSSVSPVHEYCQPAPADPSPQVRCAYYRRAYGLYADVEPVHGRIVLEMGTWGAVTTPDGLGAGVRQWLLAEGLHSPIIAHPRARRWTFLTDACGQSYLDMDLKAMLFRVYGSIAGPGNQVVLPSPADERDGYRVWIDEPRGSESPPPQSAVLETIATLTAKGMNSHGNWESA